MATKLYVGSLSYNTTNEGLKDFFAQAGEVTSAEVIMDKFSGKSRGFGFVEMATDEAAQAAINELNEKELDGRSISVSPAREKTDRAPGGGNRGGYGGGNRGGYGGGNRGGYNGGNSFRFR